MIGRLNIIKMPIIPKLNYRCNEISKKSEILEQLFNMFFDLRGWGGRDMREQHQFVATCICPNQGLNLQPRNVP